MDEESADKVRRYIEDASKWKATETAKKEGGVEPCVFNHPDPFLPLRQIVQFASFTEQVRLGMLRNELSWINNEVLPRYFGGAEKK